MDYLGRKTALIGAIGSAIEARTRPPARILDAFAGTGAVSSSLRALGYKVDANDLLPLSAIWCTALLHGSARSTFSSLSGELKLFPGTRYLQVLDALNNIAPRTGWVTRNYSPASLKHSDVERRYLTVANARHIDAIREQLRKWKPTLSRAEYALLMSSLIDAVSRVSNIAGTYGSYLKEWKRSALKALTLEPIDFGRGSTSGHSVTHVDAEIAVAESAAEVVYADPPYTKRQYAAYYHLLNTIATGEEPLLKGLTGLPNWARMELRLVPYEQSAAGARKADWQELITTPST